MIDKKRTVKRKERETLRHRYEILSAAEKVFAVKGYHKASVSDIAKMAEYSVGFIYKIFGSKEELYFDLIQKKMNELKEKIDSEIEKKSNPYDKINVIIDSVLCHFRENRDFFKIYVNEAGGFEWNIERHFGKRISEKFNYFIKQTEEIFREGIRKKYFVDLDPSILAISLAGILNGFTTYWIKSPQKRDLIEDAKHLKKLFFEGIALEKS